MAAVQGTTTTAVALVVGGKVASAAAFVCGAALGCRGRLWATVDGCGRLWATAGDSGLLWATAGDSGRLRATRGDCGRLGVTVGDCRRLGATAGDSARFRCGRRFLPRARSFVSSSSASTFASVRLSPAKMDCLCVDRWRERPPPVRGPHASVARSPRRDPISPRSPRAVISPAWPALNRDSIDSVADTAGWMEFQNGG